MNMILNVDNVETQIFYMSCLKNQNLDPTMNEPLWNLISNKNKLKIAQIFCYSDFPLFLHLLFLRDSVKSRLYRYI